MLSRPAIFLIGLLQLATHRLEFGFQAKHILRCFIRSGTVGMLLLAQPRHLLLKRRLFLLEVALGLFQLLGDLAFGLFRHLTGLLFLRHPLLEHTDLLSHPAVFLISLLQLLSDHCQLITQNAFSLTKSTFKLFHHSNSRLERFCSRICSRPTIGHYPEPFTENFYFSDIKVL